MYINTKKAKYKKVKMQKNIKSIKMHKTLGCHPLVQKKKRAKHKKSKTTKNRRKGTCTSYFPQNLPRMYRDSRKKTV